jgi:hypothetical protein
MVGTAVAREMERMACHILELRVVGSGRSDGLIDARVDQRRSLLEYHLLLKLCPIWEQRTPHTILTSVN